MIGTAAQAVFNARKTNIPATVQYDWTEMERSREKEKAKNLFDTNFSLKWHWSGKVLIFFCWNITRDKSSSQKQKYSLLHIVANFACYLLAGTWTSWKITERWKITHYNQYIFNRFFAKECDGDSQNIPPSNKRYVDWAYAIALTLIFSWAFFMHFA